MLNLRNYSLMIFSFWLCIGGLATELNALSSCEVEIVQKRDPNNPDQVFLSANASGLAPINYLWNTGDSTQRIVVEDEGEYCVEIMDSEGCIAEACIMVVSEPDSCGVEIEVLSGGGPATNLGWVLRAKAEGKEPFKYKWSTGDTTERIRVTAPGRYCVEVTAADGCVAETCAVVDTSNTACDVEIARIRGGLGNNTASLVLLAKAKGVQPITYLWSTGETSASISVDSVGVYCVTITDANGCTATECVDVEDPYTGTCDVSIRKVELSIPGAKGILLLANPIGTGPFEYQWSTGENGRAILVTTSGEYCVTVTDASGCEAEACIEIVVGGNQNCEVDIVQRNINGPLGGTLLIAIPKGQSPFRFKWSNGTFNRVVFANRPGEYCVTMVDATGCEAEACVKVGNIDPDSCAVEIEFIPGPATGGREYVLLANPKGKGPFQYAWSNGDTTRRISVEDPGRYCVKIIDTTGCTASACYVIKDENCGVTITPGRDSLQGFIYLQANPKGTAPFKFEWSTGETTQSIRVDKEGEYCVRVTDADGCQAKACFKFRPPGSDKCDVQIDHKRSNTNVGVILVASSFGEKPIQYKWSTGDTTREILITTPGRYCVEITTANGCKAEACVNWDGRVITEGLGNGGTTVDYRVFPNPAESQTVIRRSFARHEAQVRILGRDGQVMKRFVWPALSDELYLEVGDLLPGSYFIQFIQNNELTTKAFFKQ